MSLCYESKNGIAYNNIKCYLREVDLKNKPKELLIISPKATVSVLQLSNGEVLEQSLDIVYYAFKQNDSLSLSDLDKSHPIINELINKNDIIFIPLLNKYKHLTRYPEETQEYYREQAQKLFLQGMNIRLEQTSYLVDDKISIVDIAILPFIRQFALVMRSGFISQIINI